MALLPLIVGSLPSGYCWPASPQTYLNDIAAITNVQLNVTGAKYVISQTSTPAATERNFLWHNPDTGHVLYWNAGLTSWTMPFFWGGLKLHEGTLASIDTLDGGSVGAVTQIAGPFWTRATEYNDRFPIGVGAIAIGPLATGGAMTSTVAQANLPAVQLAVDTSIIGQAGVGSPEPVVGSTYGSTSVSGSGRAVDGTSTDLSARYYSKGRTEALGSGTALSVQNSYIGVYVLRRTGRLYFTS